ncbi:Hyaluronidase-1 [Diplonema papillatum]|nr:Hyaluronidase-1 [Diplonema papillatum]|eukprot:gene574-864_t
MTTGVVLCAGMLAAAAVPFGGDAPFRAWDNYRSCNATTCAPGQYGIGQANRTQTGAGCETNNCSSWSQGLFPSVNGNQTTNGGIPQRANLTLHLEKLREGAEQFVPDPAWGMHGVLDFEDWYPDFDSNTDAGSWHGKVYQNLSMEYALEKDPSLGNNPALLLKTARAQFNLAAVEFFTATLNTLHAVRPNVAWGFYGLPSIPYGPQFCDVVGQKAENCSVFNAVYGPQIREKNDGLADIWEASGALYPSAYLSPQNGLSDELWTSVKAGWVSAIANETSRLSVVHPSIVTTPAGTPAQVLPFYWPLYHNGTTAVTAADVQLLVRNSYLPPLSTQVIIWNDGGMPIMNEHFGPIDGETFRNATDSAQQCSALHCSGRGWCADAEDAFPFGAPPNPNVACECYKGSSGASCDVQH